MKTNKSELDSEFNRSLGRLISHLNRLRKRYMAEKLKRYGLSGAMYMFINALDRNPGASQDYLVGHFFMDKGNVARGAKKLEELEYIRRETDSYDRRQYNLFLTDKGKALVPVIRGHLLQWGEYLSENLSAEECAVAIDLLERMVEGGSKHFGA